MFAILIFEREPLQWSELFSAVLTWARDAGGLAAFALLIWGVAYVVRKRREDAPEWSLTNLLFAVAYAGSMLAYALFLVLLLTQGTLPDQVRNSYGKTFESWKFTDAEMTCLIAGGVCALVAVLIPVVSGLRRVRGRRIWALAKLSIKETIRQRVLWVFSLLILVVLFTSWFIDPDKPEFQLSTYIYVVDWSLTVLLLLAASLLAAFSIPSDVRSQTIHTVVTKPVERFEIVLGRILGYTLLMTAVLAAATGLGLLYLFRSINEEARQETYKARVPVYGQMRFEPPNEGVNVGREWTHRKHISGPRHRERTAPQYAVWAFDHVPDHMADRPEGVLCEFSFDVFRTHKGVQGEGIFCQFLIVTSQIRLTRDANDELQPERNTLLEINRRTAELTKQFRSQWASGYRTGAQLPPGLSRKINLAVTDQIAEEFGYFKPPPVQVTDYHTQAVTLPAGLFRNLRQPRSTEVSDEPDDAGPRNPLRAFVNVTAKSPAQLIGVAENDLYLLDLERPFAQNYVKAAFGLWYRLLLVIALAVAISTYLSGIITWICAAFFFVLGLFKEDILQLAQGLSEGGGPWISAIRVVSRKATAADLEQTPLHQVATAFDEGYQFALGLFTKLIPDVNRFDLRNYLTAGFDISWGNVLFLDTFLPLLGYLVPCLVFAFYLIKYREVANPS